MKRPHDLPVNPSDFCGIYVIVNRVNGNIYVGSSQTIKKRWGQHESELSRGIHCNPYLQNAWNKYGAGQFSFEIKELTSHGSLKEREQWWMGELLPDYNMVKTVDRDDLPEGKFGVDKALEDEASALLRTSPVSSQLRFPVAGDDINPGQIGQMAFEDRVRTYSPVGFIAAVEYYLQGVPIPLFQQ